MHGNLLEIGSLIVFGLLFELKLGVVVVVRVWIVRSGGRSGRFRNDEFEGESGTTPSVFVSLCNPYTSMKMSLEIDLLIENCC